MRTASIDIGLHNLALLIEDFDPISLSTISNIPISSRYDFNHEPTLAFKKVLKEITGEIIFIEKKNITKEKKKFVDQDVLLKLTEYLNTLKIFDTCDRFVIEKQLNSKFIKNNIASRIEHHIHSYLLIKYNTSKEVIIFPSSNKTKILGAPKFVTSIKNGKTKNAKMTKYQRKRWSEVQTKEILLNRKDYIFYDKIFNSGEKEDDFSDCLIQLQAYKYMNFIDKKFLNKKDEIVINKNNIDITIINKILKKYKSPTILNEINNLNNEVKIEIECRHKHKFWKSFNDIIINKEWCDKCIYYNIGYDICKYYITNLTSIKLNFKYLKFNETNQSKKDVIYIPYYIPFINIKNYIINELEKYEKSNKLNIKLNKNIKDYKLIENDVNDIINIEQMKLLTLDKKGHYLSQKFTPKIKFQVECNHNIATNCTLLQLQKCKSICNINNCSDLINLLDLTETEIIFED